jgi:hypothetical protein
VATPRGWTRSRTREARGAAERGRGPNVARLTPAGVGRAAGDERSHTTRTWGSSSRCLAVAPVVREPPGRRIPGSRPRSRSAGLATWARRPYSRIGKDQAQPGTESNARNRIQDRAGAGSGGETNAQESTGRLVPPGQGGSATRTDSRGEQSFEAGVTAASTGESRHARDRSDGRRLNSAGLFDLYDRGKAPSRPGSRPGPPGPRAASGPAGCGKRPEAPECVASAVVDHEPARKQRPARAGTAPREGKALEGGSKERERHERRPRSVGASRRTGGPRKGPCVPRTQPEPSRGARTLRTAPAEVWRPPSSEAAKAVAATRGTRRNGVRRGKNLTRGGPGRTSGSSPREWWGASARRPGRSEAQHSEVGVELHGRISQGTARRVRHDEEDPEAARTAWGESLEATTSAIRRAPETSAGDDNRHESRIGRG